RIAHLAARSADVGAADGIAADRLGEELELIRRAANAVPRIDLLQPDQVDGELGDDPCDALGIAPAVETDAPVNIIGGDGQLSRTGHVSLASGRPGRPPRVRRRQRASANSVPPSAATMPTSTMRSVMSAEEA